MKKNGNGRFGHNSSRFPAERRLNERNKDWNEAALIEDAKVVQVYETEDQFGKVRRHFVNVDTGSRETIMVIEEVSEEEGVYSIYRKYH